MKTKLTFSEKCAWAKKAALLDVDAEDGYEEFYRIAKESGLGERRLTYYSNAYDAAGESGIKALSYKKKMSDEIRKDAVNKINEYLYNRVPFNLRKEIGFLVKAQYNRITVSEGKKITEILGRQSSKDMIRFNPVGNECGKAREQKDLSIKAVSAQMKIPQYRLNAIEKSDIKHIQPAVLESYIDFLGIREWFNGWMHENADVYGRLKKGNNRLHD